MGCFDTNCPISGIPIKDEDKVKWGFLIQTETTSGGVYVCSDYSFMFPLMDGIANNYGNLYFNKIDLTFWKENIWNNMYKRLSAINFKEQIESLPKKNSFNEELTELIYLMHRQHLFYVDYNVKKKLRFWMVHEWAYNYICEIAQPSEEYTKHADNFIKEINGEGPLFSQTHFITGSQGGLFEDASSYIKKIDKNSLVESAKFINGLALLRKTIQPLTTCGMQHDDYTALAPWFDFLNKKCKQIKRKYDSNRD